jgi:hypothetical protein
MVLSSIQKEIIFQYRDKAYICSILCQQTSDWYNFLKTITNIPLILMSTSLSIINSLNLENVDMRVPNIVINASFALILSLINNFNISEKQANFRSLHLKYTKLTHYIEDKITNELENCTKEEIRNIINDYDILAENLDYPYPGFIRKRVKTRYFGKKTLPNILNCEIVFVNKDDNDTSLIKYLNNTNDRKVSIVIERNEYDNDNDDDHDKDDNKLISNNNPNAYKLSNSNINNISSKSLFGPSRIQREDSAKSFTYLNGNNDKKISLLIENNDNDIKKNYNIIDQLQREDSPDQQITPLVKSNKSSSSPMFNITNNKDFGHIKSV